MILRPWPMILRSFPMTDFSPLDCALITLLVLVGGVVRGSGIFGPADGLRVNMETPEGLVKPTARRGNPLTWHPAKLS